MVYTNEFVVAIKKNGKVLRESGGSTVYMPFGSEYTILLKNKSNRRACAMVEIDGTDISDGREFIIPAGGSTELKRFMLDGDMDKGNAFQFTSLTDSRVQDPTDSENGRIKVTFWREYEPVVWYEPVRYNWVSPDLGWVDYSKQQDSGSNKWKFNYLSNTTTSYCGDCVHCSALNSDQKGATIEGKEVAQSFSSSYFTKDYIVGETIIELQILAPKRAVGTGSTGRYCTYCGKKLKSNFKYCPKCGRKL